MPTNCAALAFETSISNRIVFFSTDFLFLFFFLVEDELMAFNGPTCAYLDFYF